jgi:beta-glucanase (GH16 family)
MVWRDEFDGAAIDPSRWAFEIGGSGWGNNELEFYTDRSENARLENGELVLEARAEEYLHRDYTSARLITQGLFAVAYGRIEARMRMPAGNGLWPAFWMLGTDIGQSPWPACGEIDIVEFLGREPDRAYGTVHGPGYSGGNGIGDHIEVPAGSLSDAFYVYAVEWEPGEIRWYLDEEEYFRVSSGQVPGEWVFQHPFFLILNLAVGGNWPGPPNADTVFPQTLRVDYVRVYQRPGQAAEFQGPPGAMHVAEVALSVREDGGETRAVVEIRLENAEGKPVSGADVKGGWVGAVIRGEIQGTTGDDGMLQLVSEPIVRAGDVTFCITAATHPRLTYDKSANVRNCGKVERP